MAEKIYVILKLVLDYALVVWFSVLTFYYRYLKYKKNNCNIGITHVFSCINICRVPRKLFEHEAVIHEAIKSCKNLKIH